MAELDKLTDADREAILLASDYRSLTPAGLAHFVPVFLAGKAAGRREQAEVDAKIAAEGEPGVGQDEGYIILCGCARRIREAAK